MACYYPVGTYKKDGSATKRPCGGCLGCRLDYAKDWALRCINEAQMHDENCFITLTYNSRHLPDDKSVQKKILTEFIKKLREKLYPKKIRFFGCGEYGELCKNCGKSRKLCFEKGCRSFEKGIGRPHYHAIIFGHEFDDKKHLYVDPKKRDKFSKKVWNKGHDHSLYISPMLEEIWQKGFCTIGDVTLQSAGYVARYVSKKITGEKEMEHYEGRNPEFALMSRMPGIGKTWLEKYYRDIYPKDYIKINGKRYKPPKYYDTLFEKMYPNEFEKLKKKRQESVENMDARDDWREYQKECHRKKITKRLDRRFEKC